MFRHVVLLTWQSSATGEQVSAAAAALAKLPGDIAAIRSYQFGPDAGVNPGNRDFAIVADFDDEAGYRAYRDHPAHRAFIDQYLTPIVADRCAVQYQL